jgi:hypothetical protein
MTLIIFFPDSYMYFVYLVHNLEIIVMKTSYLKKSIRSQREKRRLILTACTAFFFSVNALLTPASAQSVLFDFDNAPLHTSLPITLTQSGITAHFTATGQGYSIQTADVLGFTPPGFSGYILYPNSIYLADLLVKFDVAITYFSINYSCQELGCDDAATMLVTAYKKGSLIGSASKMTKHPGTWPVDTLKCSFAQGFDSVVVHYWKRPPTCQDYGVIFLADNMRVTPAACNPPTAQEAAISPNGPTTFCKGGSVTLSVATAGLTYQWQKGSTNISGATLQNYDVGRSGKYKCIVTNNCGSTTSNSISVTVNPLPTVTISQDPCSGGAVLLHAIANPNTGVTYQWKKGAQIISGATSATFSATTSGTYRCIVTITATGCSKTSAGSGVTINCLLTGGVNAEEAVANQQGVIIYPNPSSNYFNINTAHLDAKSMICIYDLTGRLYESHRVNSAEMQVGAMLPKGVYVLRVIAGSETKQVIKLVKYF